MPGAYAIKDGDVVETRSYYTVAQLAEFMDVKLDTTQGIIVNNRVVGADEVVYDNFTIEWVEQKFDVVTTVEPEVEEISSVPEKEEESVEIQSAAEAFHVARKKDIQVYINRQPVLLTGKSDYIFVDIFDFYKFDLNAGNGRAIITKLNGETAQFTAALKEGDQIELGWMEK